jgi:hypothetical protein
MAKKNVKKAEEAVVKVEETTQPQAEEKVVFKVKPKMKKINPDEVVKVDLRKVDNEEDATKKEETTEEKVEETPEVVLEEVKDEVEEKEEEQEEKPIIEEVKDEEPKTETKEEIKEEVVEETKEEVKETQPQLPENIQKVIDFMNETGGDLEDYVKLNQDYSKYDDAMVLREYYRQTKPHLTSSEIDFLMEDGFTYDEEVDDPKDITRKKLAFKEQVASARTTKGY